MTTGTQLAAEGIDAVLAADTAVQRNFARLIREAVDYFEGCHLRHGFTADDVHEFVEVNYPDRRPHHGNVVGGAIRDLSESGRIRRVKGDDGTRRSSRPEARGRQVQVWRVVPHKAPSRDPLRGEVEDRGGERLTPAAPSPVSPH